MKKIKTFAIIILMLSILIPRISIAAFYDMEYPPNSSGKADYTDAEADEDAEARKANASSSQDYIGKSSNNYLKSLKIENGIMEPEFNRQYVDYKVTLEDENTRKIKIIAEAEDENATIEGDGEVELQDGINNLRIVVTAENGNVQIYTLTVELPFKQSELKLENLEIYGVNIKTGQNEKEELSPKFSGDIYQYNITVSNEIVGLYIDSKVDENSYVSTIGGETLEIGENTVYVKVKDLEDDSKETTYTIKVERQEESMNNNEKPLIVIGVIIAILIILIILIIVIKSKKKKKKK